MLFEVPPVLVQKEMEAYTTGTTNPRKISLISYIFLLMENLRTMYLLMATKGQATILPLDMGSTLFP